METAQVTPEAVAERDESTIRSVERALRLLVVAAESNEGIGLVDASRAVQLAPSTVTRMLRTLESSGFVQRRDDGNYVAGAELIRLGALHSSESPMHRLAQPHLDQLADITGESCYLAVPLDRDWATYVRMAPSGQAVRHVSWLGRRIPRAGSAVGAALDGRLGASGAAIVHAGVEADTTAVAGTDPLERRDRGGHQRGRSELPDEPGDAARHRRRGRRRGECVATGRAGPVTDFEILPVEGHTRMRWANGGGWTTEIIAVPSSRQWDWRVSVADVETAGPFSPFPGVDRSIALLRGAGFALTVGGGDEQIVDAPFRPFHFSGDEMTSCRLIDGPVQDINLMATRGSVPRRLDFVRVAPSTEVELSDVDLVVVVAGRVRMGGHELGYLDTIRCPARRGFVTLTAVGDGAVVATTGAG